MIFSLRSLGEEKNWEQNQRESSRRKGDVVPSQQVFYDLGRSSLAVDPERGEACLLFQGRGPREKPVGQLSGLSLGWPSGKVAWVGTHFPRRGSQG